MEARQEWDGVVTAEPALTPTLTVAAVARRLGVAPPTLRTWDRRYGLGPSAHTAGAHRRYSPADVARLMVMRRLTLEGVSPADAAKIAVATAVTDDGRPMHTPAEGLSFAEVSEQTESLAAGFDQPPADPPELFFPQRAPQTGSDRPGEVTDRPDETGESGHPWTGVLRSVGSERGTPGGGRVIALPEGTPQNRGLARAAMSLDSYETHRILRDAIRREGVIPTWDSLIMPVLRALGERTRVTGDGIDVEHAFSEAILGVLRATTFDLQNPRSPATVLLACAESDYHSLPLHALAAALAEREIPTRMLGSGLPPSALAASVRRTGPSVVVLFARMSGADASETEALRRQRPAPALILAGPGWHAETIPGSARTAASLIEAVDEVLLAVHA